MLMLQPQRGAMMVERLVKLRFKNPLKPLADIRGFALEARQLNGARVCDPQWAMMETLGSLKAQFDHDVAANHRPAPRFIAASAKSG